MYISCRIQSFEEEQDIDTSLIRFNYIIQLLVCIRYVIKMSIWVRILLYKTKYLNKSKSERNHKVQQKILPNDYYVSTQTRFASKTSFHKI